MVPLFLYLFCLKVYQVCAHIQMKLFFVYSLDYSASKVGVCLKQTDFFYTFQSLQIQSSCYSRYAASYDSNVHFFNSILLNRYFLIIKHICKLIVGYLFNFYHNKMSEGEGGPSMIQKICQCICCSYKACGVASCIDIWHAFEAYGLAYLYCDSCCWSFCAPLFIDCKLGDTGKAAEGCAKCFKYCIFACALYCVGCCDGIYNCIEVAKVTCSTGIKGYADLTKNTQFIANKLKEALGLETGNEPLKSMGTFEP